MRVFASERRFLAELSLCFHDSSGLTKVKYIYIYIIFLAFLKYHYSLQAFPSNGVKHISCSSGQILPSRGRCVKTVCYFGGAVLLVSTAVDVVVVVDLLPVD